MENLKYLLFDCMETLIDIEDFHQPRDYAFYAYTGSGVESYWDGFAHFYSEYLKIRKELSRRLSENEEYGFLTMFRLICESNINVHSDEVNHISHALLHNYWNNYVARCRIYGDAKEALTTLKKKYMLGVVGNLKVESGVENLLDKYGIKDCFDFIITSVSVGWKKPDKRIYEAVLRRTKCLPEEHLFVGDDYENDFLAPRKLGMKALLLDRNSKHPEIADRVRSLSDLIVRL